MRRTHGWSHTPEYQAYLDARKRCTDPSQSNYKWYGGRGIEFRFTSVEEFIAALGPRPSAIYSLNRINNDGHYEPGNVEWTTQDKQIQNQCRDSRRIFNRDTMRELRTQGCTHQAIATRLGCSRALVQRLLSGRK